MIRLRLRRLANQMAAAGRPRKDPAAKKRIGNPGKKSSSVIFYVLWPMMFFVFGMSARGGLVNLHHALDSADAFWITVEFSPALVVGAAFLVGMMWLSSLLITVGSGELAKPDWDLEWLITLPVRADTLLWARILERSIVNPSGAMALLPTCTVIAWYSGYRWSAPLVGVLASWPLLLLAALARTLLDTGLRLRMRSEQLRNLNAVVSVFSIVTMYLAFSLNLPGKSAFMVGIAKSMPSWLAATPMGLAVRAINERSPAAALEIAMMFVAEVGLLLWAGVALLRHQLRHGVIAGGARDAGRRASRARPAAPAPAPMRAPAASISSPVQRRELALLSRDRNFLVQSLVLPLLIVGGQLLLGQSSVATDMWRNPNVLASVAFGLAAYSMSMSAFQTLNTEGHALWLLYTFPRSIDDVLKDKARLWGVITLAYPAVLFAIGAFVGPALSWKFLGAALTAFLGIPIYSFIAVALGVFGSNPLEQQQNHKVKPAYVYLYMLLAGLYIYAIVTPMFTQRLIFMVLTLLLSFALWQKARDRLPYLLDPDMSPPARVSLSDGLIAAMLFFVAQAIALMIFVGRSGVTGDGVFVAFGVAGGVTYALMRYVYRQAKTQGVPRIVGDAPARPMVGVAGGLIAAVIGIVYLFLVRASGHADEAMRAEHGLHSIGWWIFPLAVVAAPIFEEFIFRGLIYGGLRRSFGIGTSALASAAIFAVLHPALSMVPVFTMALIAAIAYERTRTLLAPMLVHAVYNLGIVGLMTYAS